MTRFRRPRPTDRLQNTFLSTIGIQAADTVLGRRLHGLSVLVLTVEGRTTATMLAQHQQPDYVAQNLRRGRTVDS